MTDQSRDDVPTPMTDKEEFDVEGSYTGSVVHCVHSRFARQLERELAALRAAPPSSDPVAAEARKMLDAVVELLATRSDRLEVFVGDILTERAEALRAVLYTSPQPSSDARAVAEKLRELCDRLDWKGPSREVNIQLTVCEARVLLRAYAATLGKDKP